MTDYDLSRNIRAIPVTPAEEGGLQPTTEDLAEEAETQTDTFRYALLGTEKDKEFLRSMLTQPRAEGRKEFFAESGLQQHRQEKAATITLGLKGKRGNRATPKQDHPNSRKARQSKPG